MERGGGGGRGAGFVKGGKRLTAFQISGKKKNLLDRSGGRSGSVEGELLPKKSPPASGKGIWRIEGEP